MYMKCPLLSRLTVSRKLDLLVLSFVHGFARVLMWLRERDLLRF